MDFTQRTAMLLGSDGMARLAKAHVAVFGLGGVGGSAAEALVRSGVGHISLVDHDTVTLSNLNRQVVALRETVGQFKTEAMAQRLFSINPDLDVQIHTCFFDAATAEQFAFLEYDYVVDAIDTVTSKLLLAELCDKLGVPLIASMGTGNKLDPTRLTVTDLYQTSVCPLARVMRSELRKRGVKKLKVVYSEEPPLRPLPGSAGAERRSTPGSTAFVPPAAGMIAAAEVVRALIQTNR